MIYNLTRVETGIEKKNRVEDNNYNVQLSAAALKLRIINNRARKRGKEVALSRCD